MSYTKHYLSCSSHQCTATAEVFSVIKRSIRLCFCIPASSCLQSRPHTPPSDAVEDPDRHSGRYDQTKQISFSVTNTTHPTRSGLQSGLFRINSSAVVGAGWDLVDQTPPHRTLMFLVRSINVHLLDGFGTRIVEHSWPTDTSPYPGTPGTCSTDHYDRLLHRHGVARRPRPSPFHPLGEALSDNRVAEWNAQTHSSRGLP